MQDTTKQIGQLLASGNRLPPPSRPLDMSQRPIRHCLSLSESETRGVIAHAKQLGVSLSALLQAANGLAQLKLNSVRPGEDASFPLPIANASPERHLKPSINPKTYFTSSLCLIPLSVQMAEPLRQGSEKAMLTMTARQIQEQFNKYSSHPCLPMMMPLFAQLPPTAPPAPKQEATTDTNSPSPPWLCDFQNLGVIESRIATRQGHISIDQVCTGVRAATTMSIRTWTMHGKLHVQVEGAAAWGDGIVKEMLKETIRIGLLIVSDTKL